MKAGDPYHDEECDANCQKGNLCEIVSADNSNEEKCKEMVEAFDVFAFTKSALQALSFTWNSKL